MVAPSYTYGSLLDLYILVQSQNCRESHRFKVVLILILFVDTTTTRRRRR